MSFRRAVADRVCRHRRHRRGWGTRVTRSGPGARPCPGRVAALVVGAALLAIGAPAQAQDPEQAGRMVFFSQGCYGCHRIGVAGTPVAHDLSRVGRKYSEDELARWLRNPSGMKAGAHMPRLSLSEDEIRALARYLSALR